MKCIWHMGHISANAGLMNKNQENDLFLTGNITNGKQSNDNDEHNTQSLFQKLIHQTESITSRKIFSPQRVFSTQVKTPFCKPLTSSVLVYPTQLKIITWVKTLFCHNLQVGTSELFLLLLNQGKYYISLLQRFHLYSDLEVKVELIF